MKISPRTGKTYFTSEDVDAVERFSRYAYVLMNNTEGEMCARAQRALEGAKDLLASLESDIEARKVKPKQ